MEAIAIESPKRIDAQISRNFSYLYLMACLFYAVLVTSTMWFYPVTDENEAMIIPGGRFLSNSVLLTMASCLVLFYRHVFALFLQYKLLTALILVHFASVITSIEPMESLTYSIRIAILVAFFGISAMILKPEKYFNILIGFFVIAGIANLLYVLGIPQYGIMSGMHEGAWRGLFSHKNQFGYFCAYGLILCFNLLPRSFLFYGAIGILYLVLLGKSQSGGAIATAAAGLIISSALIYSQRIHWNFKALTLFTSAAIIIAAMPFYGILSEWLLTLLGKDSTLTNRTIVWDLYLAEFWKSPALGLGANAYLFNDAFTARIEAGLSAGDQVSPHNGYLATLIQVGIIGLAIYCLVSGRIIIAGLLGALRASSTWHKVFVLFTLLHLIRGIAETNGSIKLSLFFGLVIVAYVYLTKKEGQTHELTKTRES